MSKLARKPIDISNVEVTYEQRNLSIKGKHGQLNISLVHGVELEVTNDQITVSAVKKDNLPKNKKKKTKPFIYAKTKKPFDSYTPEEKNLLKNILNDSQK